MKIKNLQNFLYCLSLETGIVFIVIFDIIHLLWHFALFLPQDSGRRIYIFYEAFNVDADLFLFYTTNLALIIIKICYGLKVIQKRFRSYTHTYAVLTQLVSLLVVFLDLALTVYLTHHDGTWHGWPFVVGLLGINIYFIMVAKSLHQKVKEEKELTKTAMNKNSALIGNEDSDDSEVEDVKELNEGEDENEEVKKRV